MFCQKKRKSLYLFCKLKKIMHFCNEIVKIYKMLNFFGKLQRDIQKVTSPAPASAPTQREEREDKEIVFSKSIKAGKRMYYLDVKKDRRSDLFLSITESKRKSVTEEGQFIFEKHKIFLYKEDFDKFEAAFKEALDFMRAQISEQPSQEGTSDEVSE
jgi:hypothetical protein